MDILQSDLAFSQFELVFLRQCIDFSTISAKEAKFVAQLQMKIENEIQQMEVLKQQQEDEKQKQLEEIKASSKKKSN